MAGGAREFAWDGVPGMGSPEHYWHLLFGYLLPLSHALASVDRSPISSCRLHDCGPVMNGVVAGVLARLDRGAGSEALAFDRSVAAQSTLQGALERAATAAVAGANEAATTVVPRWDLWVVHGGARDKLRGVLFEARDMLADALRPFACCKPGRALGRHLVLKRSEEPDYYRPGGPAVKPAYGVGRRSFLGLEEGSAELERLGVANLVYEPGAHNLGCQIVHFSECAGVIGVRGAEFANILWAPADAVMVMFMSSAFRDDNPPPRALAQLLGQRFLEVPHGGAANPQLDARWVAAHLRAKQNA